MSEPEKLQLLLKRAFSDLCPREALADMKIIESWIDFVDQNYPMFNKHTRAEKIDEKRNLHIRIKSAAIANEIFMQKDEVERAFQEFSNCRDIKVILKK